MRENIIEDLCKACDTVDEGQSRVKSEQGKVEIPTGDVLRLDDSSLGGARLRLYDILHPVISALLNELVVQLIV